MGDDGGCGVAMESVDGGSGDDDGQNIITGNRRIEKKSIYAHLAANLYRPQEKRKRNAKQKMEK